jgi:putative two-component system response regulator
MQILIVDDNNFMLQSLDHALMQRGHVTVSARNGRQALDILRRGDIRLVITDWEMPGMSGLQLCRAVRREHMAAYVYIIMLTGVAGAKSRREGLNAGADDFLNKPLDPEDLDVCLNTAARIIALETRDLALFALAKLAESRDPDVGEHLERVQNYALLLASNLSDVVKEAQGIDDEYLRLLYQTSALHDLGKVGIPDAVLLKPGRLTHEEFEIMKTHTLLGAHTLNAALQRFPNVRFLQMARDIAAAHHEKMNGSGYPAGLAGGQIPFCAKLVSVADVYDAITNRRVYKPAMTHEQARDVIVAGRGIHFDPAVVDAFFAAEKQMINVHQRLSEGPADFLAPAGEPRAPEVSANPVDCASMLSTMSRRLEAMNITDDLTGLLNRRQAMNRLEEQRALAERYSRPLSLFIVDLDHFKEINDAHGHETGDVILRRVAQLLGDQAPASDCVCRIGGDEFLVILPAHTTEQASAAAERCRSAVAARDFTVGSTRITVTVSIGVAAYASEMTHFPDLLRAAEAALDAAKNAGRDQVRTTDSNKRVAMNHLKLTSDVPTPDKSAAAPVNMVEVLARCGGDSDFAATVTEHFRTQALIEVERLEKALAAADVDAVRRNAHNLKSMAAYMIAKDAADLSQQVEQSARDNRLAEAHPLVPRLRMEIERAIEWITKNTASKTARCA